MKDRIAINGLEVDRYLYNSVNERYIPDTGIDANAFWLSFASIVRDLTPRNKELLQIRKDLQEIIDRWHVENKNMEHDAEAYEKFLVEIGYI